MKLNVAVPTLLYGSKTSIKKNKNINKIQAAKMKIFKCQGVYQIIQN
jgi:hypothetical protein